MSDAPTELVLVADIGGTFARFGLARGTALVDEPMRVRRADHPDLASACRAFLAGVQGAAPRGAAIAAAGQVRDGRIAMTNADWRIEAEPLREALGLERVVLLNDFAALAWALPLLGADDAIAIDGEREAAIAPAAEPGVHVVVGPGTGLGVGALARTADGRWIALASEGGHASFAAGDPLEQRLRERACERYGRASWERVVSGAGLELIHEVLGEDAASPSAAVSARDIVAGALDGSDAQARESVRVFVGLLAAYAGDLALLFNAAGGVAIGGGLIPRVIELIDHAAFRRRFEDKGRFAPWMRTVPVRVLTYPYVTLRGAANAWSLSR